MITCCLYLVIGVSICGSGFAMHSDLRKELMSIKNIVTNIDGKLQKVDMIEAKLQDMEKEIGFIKTVAEELRRKSSLLREIHQDNDGRSELLQRIARAIDDINRKYAASSGRKYKSEADKLDTLSENVQALFQIFSGLSRKLDDFHSKVEKLSDSPSTVGIDPSSKKLDALITLTTSLTECLQCRRGQTVKDMFQSTLRHVLDRKLQICTASDIEKSVSRIFDPKMSNLLETFQNDLSFKFKKLGSEFEDVRQGCRISSESIALKITRDLGVAAGDMMYSHDNKPKESRKAKSGGEGDPGTPRETPGRIFRKLWRKMTEPIKKVSDKIDTFGHKLEAFQRRQFNQSSESCVKQVQILTSTVDKLDSIESQQLIVQNMCSKILSELERVKSVPGAESDGSSSVTGQSFKQGGGSEFFNGSSRGSYQVPTNCAELREQGIKKSGVFTLKPKNSTEEFPAYCDMETDNGGWTVLQRRGDFGEERQNFTQPWIQYRNGFGDFQREFWIGNEKIHLLSMQEDMKLRVQLEDFEGNSAYAEYSKFAVEDEGHQYRLSVGEYEGNATDSLSLHDGKLFSTEDRDNDEVSSCCNCADTFKGGWWYYRCFEANLNGPYHTIPTENGYFLGIIWERWKGDYSLKSSEMKIRPLSYDELQDP